MRSFRFSLEPVLSYRRQVEEMRKREFALAHRAMREHMERLQSLFVEEARVKGDLRVQEAGALDLGEIRAQRRYLAAVVRRIVAAREQAQRRAEEQAVARAAYLKAGRERRVLERLRERRHEDWAREASREEQKFMDEIAGRTRRPGPDAESA